MTDEHGIIYKECIAGNIIGKHYYGTDKQIKSGTKHFGAGAKVYCIFMYGGMGHQEVRVMGKIRKSSRMIDVVMRTCYIKNFRMQKVYHPKVIKFIDKYFSHFESEESERAFMKMLNENHVEIREV